MPTYDYLCNACGHRLEAFHSINEPPLKKCPKCKKPKLERQIGSGAGILFKGGGFYQTDYRSESYKQGESAEKTPKPAESAPAKSAPEKPKAAKPAPKKSD
jgi:putative FmdB family regulatory protein